jgi:hypothetical protein
MVLVPPGDYIVGGTDASPRRVITLTHGFFMDRTEVTQARYAEFVRATNRPPLPGWTEDGLPPPGTEQWPVVLVTWQDATAFAAWAGKSLPTEEQWECACRGPGGQTYAWGNKWEPAMAELSFGPAPVGAMEKDRSPCGGSDMIGNVAEWTSTHLEGASGSRETADAARGAEPAIPGRSGASDRGGNVLYAVKGNSWAGIEKDRPTVIVPAESASGDPLLCLTQSPDAPEVPVRFRHNIEMQYVGAIVGETATARVLVRKWMPNWDQWAETIFSNLSVGDMIGAPKVLLVEDPGGKAKGVRPANVDFSTGCAVVRQEPEGWLEIRDPNGFIRRLQYVKGVVARQVKVGQTREPPPLLDLSLDASCAAYNRMPGRRNARYLNVGFRCTKVLWTPPQEMDGMAEKPEKSGAAERPDGAEKAGGPHGAPPAASQEGSQPRGGAAGTRPQQPPARPRSGPKL